MQTNLDYSTSIAKQKFIPILSSENSIKYPISDAPKQYVVHEYPVETINSQEAPIVDKAYGETKVLIEKRINELKRFAKEDGEVPPLLASEEALFSFLSAFPLQKFPELTFADDGCYYLRIVRGQNKLVVLFLEDKTLHYLIEERAGYLENTSSFDFFKNQHSAFVRELTRNV